jgi:hypothetical protein
MNWLKRLFRAAVRGAALSPRAPSGRFSLPERLENRTFFTTGPSLAGETLLGSAQDVTAVVLTFNEHLDPATAQNVGSYGIGRHVTSGSDSGLLGDLGGLFFLKHAGSAQKSGSLVARPDSIVLHPDRKGVHGGRVAFTSAVYDDATMSVTLTPSYPIKATKFFRYVHVSGTGTTAVTNTLGQAMVGNNGGVGNIRVAFKPKQGKTVQYYDATGNRITLKLKGPGTIVAFLRTGPNPQPLILLQGTYAGKSVLTGTIKPAPGVPATTDIQELLGTSNSDCTNVLNNLAFAITNVLP